MQKEKKIGGSMKLLHCTLLMFMTIVMIGCANQFIDEGGVVYDYQKFVLAAQKNKTRVVIDYKCESACLIKLSSGPGLCVSKDAKFGVHEPRYAPGNMDYSQGIRVEKYVRLFKSLLPACAVKLFDSKHAFDSPKIIPFSGKEVLQSCPEIQECRDT